MRAYEFTLILDSDPTDEQSERLAEHFGAGGAAPDGVIDVTLSVLVGIPRADCTVRAASFDEAVAQVLPGLGSEGITVERIEMPPDVFAPAA